MRLEVNRRRGELRISVERMDDLHYLYLLVDEGDIFCGWTARDFRPAGAKSSERIRVYLCLRVEALEYHKFRGSLRVRGVVVSSLQDLDGVLGKHHTIDVVPGSELLIKKPEEYPFDLVEEIKRMASRSSAKLLIVSVDDDEVAVALATPFGLDVRTSLERGGSRAGVESKEELLADFYREANKLVEELVRAEKPDRVVLVGPSLFVDLYRRITKYDKDFVFLSAGGLAGVYELQRLDLLSKYGIEHGSKYVERIMRELAVSPGKVALGIEELRRWLEANAVDAIVVTDETFKEFAREIKGLLSLALRTRAKLVIVPESSEPGERLKSLGGIAVLLRYSAEA